MAIIFKESKIADFSYYSNEPATVTFNFTDNVVGREPEYDNYGYFVSPAGYIDFYMSFEYKAEEKASRIWAYTNYKFTNKKTGKVYKKQIDDRVYADEAYSSWYCRNDDNDIALAFGVDGRGSYTYEITVRFGSYITNPEDDSRVFTFTGDLDFYLPQYDMSYQLLTAPNFSDEENPTITYKNIFNWTALTSKPKAKIYMNDQEIISKDLDKTKTSYTFNLTEAERELLRNEVKRGTSADVVFSIDTSITGRNVSEVVQSQLTKVFTLVDAYPQATFNVIDVDAVTTDLTGNNRKFIKYYSDALYELNATASKGAAIISEEVSCGNKKSDLPSDTLENIESNTFYFMASDSRNNAVSGNTTVDMIDYIKLTCNQKIELELSDGDATGAKGTLTISGNYWRGNFGAAANSLFIQTRQTDANGQMGDWVTLTDFVEVEYKDNTYTLSVGISGLDYAVPYTFQSRAIDKLDTATTAEYTTRIKPVFDWSGEDFSFNVPVSFDGDLMADMVIAVGSASMGTNGTWNWRKWKSGRVDCYGCRNFGNMAVTTAWGNLYRSESFNQSLPSGLFIDTPEAIDISFRGATNYGGWIARHEGTAASKDNCGGFIVCCPASATLQQGYIGFNVIGRWK